MSSARIHSGEPRGSLSKRALGENLRLLDVTLDEMGLSRRKIGLRDTWPFW